LNVIELKTKMLRNEKTPDELCAAMGISKTSWYRKTGGESQFTLGEISIIRRELSLTDRETAIIFFDGKVS